MVPSVVKSENEYDSRNRQVARIAAEGTAQEARAETDYDAASNAIEVRSPRYFDANDPPIAGLGSVAAADGLTEQFLYDDDLTDGVGLDNATGASPLIGSTAVSLADAITKLADTTANGGAGVAFDADATGSARVSINPEGEVRFSISDAAGRSVMSGVLVTDRITVVVFAEL